MPTLVFNGHDLSGPTTARPTNVEAGQPFYDTTLGVFLIYNGTAWEPVSGDVSMSSVAAAGSAQGDAGALVAGFNLVSAADGTKGVKLPTAAASLVVEGYNNSASALLIYPNTSDDINDGTVNVAVTVAARTAFRFVATDTTTWSGLYAASGTTVTLTGTETLTNKTLTSPVITQPGSTFPTYIPHGAHAASVAAAGAVPITNFYSTLDSNAGATTATLADGAVKGQLKKIRLIVDGGDVVLTPANLAGGTTITFADAGDTALLVWNGSDWVAIELSNDADGATAPVLA